MNDDTALVQGWIDRAIDGRLDLPAGTYRITRNLYLHGRLDLIGSGAATLLLDADLGLADGPDYWINAGAARKGVAAAPWTGRIAGITFVVSARGSGCGRVLNVHRGQDWRVERCTFDVTSTGQSATATGAIGCYNNANWCPSPVKREGRIVACRFLADQAAAHGSEAIGLGNAQEVWVLGNRISGWGDDAIGVHTCDDFIIENNRCLTRDGRIYISGSRRGIVRGNHVERVADWDGTWASGGSLIQAEIEASYQPAPTGLVIAANQLVHGSGIASPTYGVRLRAVRDCLVAGNLIRDDSGHGYGITWEGQAPSGWSDATGLDADGTARVRSLRVVGNLDGGLAPPTVQGYFAAVPDGAVAASIRSDL